MINTLLLYCRAGFEPECAAEIQALADREQAWGYAQTERGTGYVLYHCQDPDSTRALARLPVAELIFCRQLIRGELMTLTDRNDRISPLMEWAQVQGPFRDFWVETPDTNEGKELSKLCRKLTVPLRQRLRQTKTLDRESPWWLHVCFLSGDRVFVGSSHVGTHCPHPMGIVRLRVPRDAPSRSTLKLDEALLTLFDEQERQRCLKPLSRAVDLGASPGGWTYQLVRHGMRVTAVDNGPMNKQLMDNGDVEHIHADGFTFEPKHKPVTMLVCDMVDKPMRVAELMASWAVKGWTQHAVFNLKLPMKQRYSAVQECLDRIEKRLQDADIQALMLVKHLYHDREEVTVRLSVLQRTESVIED